MFKNYVKIAWRVISRSKGYSLLNILGLATGMAVALVIGLWVHYQYSFDRFLPGAGQVYQVARNFNSNGDTLTFQSTSLRLAEALRNHFPQIEYVAEGDGMGSHGLVVGDKKLYIDGGRVGSDFLHVFPYDLLKGNAGTVLTDPYSIVLTQSTAKALFGDADPLGKFVRVDNANNLKVTGILKDIPANSSLQFNYLIPFSYYEITSPGLNQNRTGSFSNNGFVLYVRLKSGDSYAQVAPQIRDIEHTETNNSNAMLSEVILQPMLHWHLYEQYKNGKETGGFIDYIRIFTIIGILVLLIACINFINLSTARSAKRAREVGVRKAIGSPRRDLILQFLAESFILTGIAAIASLILVQLSLPWFNTLSGSMLSIPYSSPLFWLILMGGVLFTALVAGSRPAFYLSSFNPVRVLKGNNREGKGAALPRKILVVVQFSCSVALIIGTVVVYQQIQYAKDRPTGIDTNRMLMTESNKELRDNIAPLRNELIREGVIDNLTIASSPATYVNGHSDVAKWPGKLPGETIEMGTIFIGDDYFKTMGMQLQSGRDFADLSDTLNVVFNEAAIQRMRIKEPIGRVITWNGSDFRIIGVVKNALMLSPFMPADPSMFLYYPPFFSRNNGTIMYHLSPNIGTRDALAKLGTAFNAYSPSYPYSYNFADEAYASKFALETLIGKLAALFAGLAIFISCLGILGLATYMAEQRTKEIGIRKVLGASIPQVWLLLSREFILLVLLSSLFASPFALYFLHNWLQQYDYRISIHPSVFLLAGGAALLVTLITVSFQSIRAALANPVQSLRSE